MNKKCLVIYATHTGNTEKVALRIKNTFTKHGWECDMFKLDRKTDLYHPGFNFSDYDFVCVGSGVELHLPYDEIIAAMRIPRYGYDPKQLMVEMAAMSPGQTMPVGDKKPVSHHRIEFGPGSKKAVVFVTYAGYDLGAEETEPSLALLALEVQHLEFQCIGRFACPGKFVNESTPETYWGDIRDRPNERDLLKAEIFIEEVLEAVQHQYV